MAARQLILTQGYPATRVDEICEAAGVSKGSFYHFFDSKEDLGQAVLQHYFDESSPKAMNGAFRQIDDPVKRVYGFLDHMESLSKEFWAHGCLFGVFAIDLSEVNPPMRERISEYFYAIRDSFADVFEPICIEGNGRIEMTAQELAEQYLQAIEGAVVMAKAHDDWSQVTKGLRNFRLFVELMITAR